MPVTTGRVNRPAGRRRSTWRHAPRVYPRDAGETPAPQSAGRAARDGPSDTVDEPLLVPTRPPPFRPAAVPAALVPGAAQYQRPRGRHAPPGRAVRPRGRPGRPA